MLDHFMWKKNLLFQSIHLPYADYCTQPKHTNNHGYLADRTSEATWPYKKTKKENFPIPKNKTCFESEPSRGLYPQMSRIFPHFAPVIPVLIVEQTVAQIQVASRKSVAPPQLSSHAISWTFCQENCEKKLFCFSFPLTSSCGGCAPDPPQPQPVSLYDRYFLLLLLLFIHLLLIFYWVYETLYGCEINRWQVSFGYTNCERHFIFRMKLPCVSKLSLSLQKWFRHHD